MIKFILALCTALPLPAQIATGSMFGAVRDPSGLAIAGVTVNAIHVTTGRERSVATGEAGSFVLSGLETGRYTLTFSASGFKKIERKDIALSSGDRLAIGDVTLEIGAVTEVISITAQGAAVQTQSAERAEVITPKQIENLLVRGRNVMDLAALLPGVVAGNPQEDLNSSSTLYVQGNRSTTNNITIDGVPATDMGNGSQLKLVVGQDNVSEVKILTSNYQAEYGRMSGSNIIMVTKSGTKEFHGLGSYFKRHEQFNANNFFNNRNGIAAPRYRYNTWTYNVGGPVTIPKLFNTSREKLFFFWGQEFWPTKFASTGQITVPTALEKNGDYSQTVELNGQRTVVRDPLANAPFAGNIIPSSRIDRNGQSLLKILPEPNFLDRRISAGQYNYVFVAPRDTPKKTNTLKLDYNLNASNSFSGSFNSFNEDHTGTIGLPSAGGINWPMSVKTWFTHPKSLTARYTRVFTPRLINEFHMGYLTQPARDTYTDDELKKITRETVGFTVGQFSPKANPLNVIPNATFGGIPGAVNITTEGRFPLYNEYKIYNFTDNVTYTRASHTLKAGIYLEHFSRDQKKTVAFNGAFDFGRNVNNPLDTNYAFANAALGVFNNYSEISGPAFMEVRQNAVEAFVQDNWRITKRLTLDYGVRFYWIPPLTEANDQISGFIPSRYDATKAARLIEPGFDAQGRRIGVHPVTGQQYVAAQIGAIAPNVGDSANGMVVAANDASAPRGLVPDRGLMFGPRLGFAYDVFGNGKTAVRGGIGVFYNRYTTENYFGQLVGQPPLLNTPQITYGEVSKLLSSSGLLYPTNVFGSDGIGKIPAVYNYSLAVQRDIGFQTILDVAYAGSLGRHLFWRRDINPIAMGANFDPRNFDRTQPGRALPAAFLRPLKGYNNITLMEGASGSNYHSLQVSAKRRFAKGLDFGLAWTWSKVLDYNDTDTQAISPLVPVRQWNYGLADFDRTHVLVLNYIWDVPQVRTQSTPLKMVFNGWQFSGITSFISGQPLPVGYSTTTAVDITGTPSQDARIDVLSNPVLPKSERTFDRNFRTDAFRLPARGTVGTAAKTLIRGPGINNFDVALFKNFPIRESIRMQFRWELYNAFNHTQFSGLDNAARFNPANGDQANARFGQFTAARTPRQMQLSLRLYF